MSAQITPRIGAVVIAAASGLVAPAAAQTVATAAIIKIQFYQQTSATEVSLLPAAAVPFGFNADVEGEDIGLLDPAPAITGPISVPEPTHNGGVLGYNAGDDVWAYGAPDFNDYGTETLVELDALFGEGDYTFTVSGVTIPLHLGPVSYPAAAPLITLTGGSWDNGVYRIAPDTELTLTSSTFTEFDNGADGAASLEIYGDDYGDGLFVLSTDTSASELTIVVPAGSLTEGMTYFAGAFHTLATDFTDAIPGLPGALAAAGYEKDTELMIVVGPVNDCAADFDGNGLLDLADIIAFVTAFSTQSPAADFDGNGLFDLADVIAFVTAFQAGCP
ncbi:MAG: hypothetical protein H6810_05295 [Phycisphaeraceae bacterium]|nr:MAG: hypothetical protein H6810_05295 [Phycisphaeraceae bacterium]